MSLIQDVTAMVEKLGEVRGDVLLPHFPGHSRAQVFQALQNARYSGRIRLVRRGRYLGNGRRGVEPGVYAPVAVEAAERKLPANSIFQMGERAGAQA